MEHRTDKKSLAALSLGALGVVYGDIGTSPLYTIQTVFSKHSQVALTTENIFGAVSAIFWLLMLVVTLKYIILVLRADNHGEGGIMALLALAISSVGGNARLKVFLIGVGTIGAALFLAECFITPAISVLSAIEGLKVLSPTFSHWVVPLSCIVLVVLFIYQKHGTGFVGQYFGPVMITWFLTLALVGVYQIAQNPSILSALNPRYAVTFLLQRDGGYGIFLAIGAIVLAVTGTEALYADMGHFGKRAIRVAWTGLVFPALALNYLGQGALLLSNPAAVENPFYNSFPSGWLVPAILIATAATVIASQAVITGAFSIVQQAIQLGLLPRMRIVHTSSGQAGQIYISAVNWVLLSVVLIATISFRSSTSLAAAYGISVTGTMLLTTVLTFFVVRGWGISLPVVIFSSLFFLCLDLLLFISCTIKFFEGGWFPVLIGIVLCTLMWTWKQGRELLMRQIRDGDIALTDFLGTITEDSEVPRVDRTAVYLVSDPATVPQAMLHNLKHNMVLHSRNVITTVRYQDVPWVDEDKRLEVKVLSQGFWQVYIHYGFMDHPDIPKALSRLTSYGLNLEDPMLVSYFISRETVVPSPGKGMSRWREELFAAMSRNAGSVVGYFNIPPNSVIELGSRVHI